MKHQDGFLGPFKNRAWHVPRWLQRLDAVTIALAQRAALVRPTRTRTHAHTRATALAGPTAGFALLATATCCYAQVRTHAGHHASASGPSHSAPPLSSASLGPHTVASLDRERWATYVHSHHQRRVRLHRCAVVPSSCCCRPLRHVTAYVASCHHAAASHGREC